ncbi:MAG: hypothetical protein J6I50_05245 [Clostridia bacterium]|nr:hypothetical protein [Clostridia bacterium]
MMKILSVFALYVRSSFYKIIVLLLLMTAGQILFFYRKLSRALDAYAGMEITAAETGSFIRLEDMFSAPYLWIVAAAFLLITVCLCLGGTAFGARTGYTMQRLGISERGTFVCQAGYNLLVYLLFWAWEAVLCYGLCRVYCTLAPGAFVSVQSTALAFYRCSYLHALLPLSDIAGWVCNGLWVLTLSVSSAAFPFFQRRGTFSSEIVLAVIVVLSAFRYEAAGIYQFFMTVVLVGMLLVLCYRVYAAAAPKEESLEQEVQIDGMS